MSYRISKYKKYLQLLYLQYIYLIADFKISIFFLKKNIASVRKKTYFVMNYERCLGMNNNEVLEYLQSGQRITIPSSCECPNELYNVMLNCWDENPENRSTFSTLYNFFDNYFGDL